MASPAQCGVEIGVFYYSKYGFVESQNGNYSIDGDGNYILR